MNPENASRNKYSVELETLLACARNGHATDVAVVSGNIAPDPGIDWARLLEQAERQRLLLLLHRYLQGAPAGAVPAEFQRAMAARCRELIARNLLLIDAASKLAAAFAEAELPFVFCKGPILAALAWGGSELRSFCDIDVLISPETYPEAVCGLRKLGFVPDDEFTPIQEKVFLRLRGARHFVNPAGVCIELHVSVTPRYFAPALANVSDFVQHRQFYPVNDGEFELPGLSPADQLLTVCVHGARHLWSCLSYVLDVAGLVRAFPALEWERLLERSRDLGVERRLLLGLNIARLHLDCELPATIETAIARDQKLARLTAAAEAFLFDPLAQYPGTGAIIKFHLACLQGLPARIGYCRRLLFTTAPEDWRACRLPAPLFFGYALLRPFRLLGKYIRLSGWEPGSG